MKSALLNKKIKNIYVSKGEHDLFFKCEISENEYITIAWKSVGACCSESWWSEILNIPVVIDSEILEVNKLELINYNLEDGRCRSEVDEVYGFQIKTVKGSCDLIFRNSSNGYYGGWMAEEALLIQDFSNLKEITDFTDWRSA